MRREKASSKGKSGRKVERFSPPHDRSFPFIPISSFSFKSIPGYLSFEHSLTT